MKKTICFTAILGALLFASCKRNNCESQYCDNGGTCVNGACSCPQGYSGLHCDSSNTGLVTFWASSNCNDGPINVTCGTYNAKITEYFPADTPTCGSQGCANFRLYAGTYNYSAANGDSAWNGTVVVTLNGCTLERLGCATGNITFYFDTAGENAATVTIGGNTGQVTTSYTTSVPTCGAPGCANFSLPTGKYTYTATSSSGTWSDTVTITANACILKLL